MTAGRQRQPATQSTGRLGRGLAALIPQHATAVVAPVDIPLVRIKANPYQPRHRVEQEALERLAQSIAQHGVLQPILVTETLDGYQLVAGERRVRAAQLAGLERIPAVVRQMADRDQLALALVENIQRADLNPLEEAQAYRQLIADFGLSQEQVADRVGRARSTVANTLRLLDLDPGVQEAVADGRLTEGHARAMGALTPALQLRVLEAVAARELSVRETEELVRRLRDPATPRPARRDPDSDVERVEEELRRALGTKVTLARSRRGGRIVIEFYSEEELGRLYDRLTGGTA